MSGVGEPGRRHWPPYAAPDPDDALDADCAACGAAWSVHRDLGGFRLRCECGAWIAVPAPPAREAPTPLGLDPPRAVGRPLAPPPEVVALQDGSRLPVRRDEEGLFVPLAPPSPLDDTELPTDVPFAPGALRHAPVDSTRRWIDRSALEIVGIFLALVLPDAALFLWLGPDGVALMPFASIFGAVLAIAIGWRSRHYAFGALRAPRARHVVEALGATAVALVLVFLWMQVVESAHPDAEDILAGVVDRLGLGWALFSIAVCPAFLEEFACRGLLQGRIGALTGARAAVVIQGAIFGLMHGVTLGLPFHAGLGVYLGWLRLRSRSLVPGMLLHFLYNGTITALWL